MRLANDKADDLTIKKLTRDNPTMAKMFKDAKESADLLEEIPVDDVD